MDRNQVLWTITAFFGATVVYSLIRTATKGQPQGVTTGLQAVALAIMILGIVIFMRMRGGD